MHHPDRESHLHSQVKSCKRKCFAQEGKSGPPVEGFGAGVPGLSLLGSLWLIGETHCFLTTVNRGNWQAEFRISSIRKSDVTGEELAQAWD